MLRDEINTALKVAMKARDERRVSTLRLVNAVIKNADIEAETTKKSALSDDDLLGLLQKMIKQRQELVDIYDKAGRKELADQERGEIEIIRAYLPQADVGGRGESGDRRGDQDDRRGERQGHGQGHGGAQAGACRQDGFRQGLGLGEEFAGGVRGCHPKKAPKTALRPGR